MVIVNSTACAGLWVGPGLSRIVGGVKRENGTYCTATVGVADLCLLCVTE